MGTPAVTMASLNKGQSLIFNNMGVSQIQPQSQVLIQQPSSPMQQPQNRGMCVIYRGCFKLLLLLLFFVVVFSQLFSILKKP